MLKMKRILFIYKGLAYNQPKFYSSTIWNPNGIVIANSSIIGTNPYGMFINKNDIIYVIGRSNTTIYIWMNNSLNPTTSISTNPLSPFAIFVTSNNEIYTGPRNTPYTVNVWTVNGSYNQSIVAYATSQSYGLFVDINNTLYISLHDEHKIVSKSLQSSSSNVSTVVAGTGSSGNSPNSFNGPHGVFVDTNFDLYVADTHNDRIQFFQSGQQNGITIAGIGSLNVTITLNDPEQVILDFDKNLFIVDRGNDRIVASGSNGFRCILGCTGSSGSTNDKFLYPVSMAFDSCGNIYVADYSKHTVQKFLRLTNDTSLTSYNQPTFCSNPTWNSNATTFANNYTIGGDPHALYVDTNNTIYAVNRAKGQILIWMNNSSVPDIVLYTQLSSSSYSIFVTTDGDIYVDDSNSIKKIVKTNSYTNNSILIANVSSIIYGLFIDINNTLYCSMYNQNQVVKKWLNDNSSAMITVAGNGSAGSASNSLTNPFGIFVDINFDLYIADRGNNRIQLFQLGQLTGITVVGSTSTTPTISLFVPMYVILDRNKYLFVSDSSNNRIIGSDENGFRCVVGCSNSPGSASNQLNFPRSIAFDSFGNLFVADRVNNRIQKFTLSSDLCNSKIRITHKNIRHFYFII